MGKIKVEVVYAEPARQCLIAVEVEAGSTLETAIRESKILDIFPDIDLKTQKVGVFSKPRLLSDEVKKGDRIEIYRPLVIDPKEARRVKAAK
jgi:putative ubiquitin-RnfH superfamily antitoxin RatB of RatAB toxin-antitoxin module